MILVSILAQIIYNFKGILTFKEIQKLPSVKFYSNVLLFGPSSLSLSIISAISKTLSSDSEIFSSLTNMERFTFLFSLKESFFQAKNYVNTKNIFYNSLSYLRKFRKRLSLQFRSILLSTTLIYPNSISFGLHINNVSLDFILESSKFIWISLGLFEEDFSFMLIKEFCSFVNPLNSKNKISSTTLEIEAVKALCKLEFSRICPFSNFFIFERDFLVFNSYDNMVYLERDLGFLKRVYIELYPYY